MDAKITKSRLANLLSYDWLKIIAAILAVVFLLIVFFTTIKTRAREEQIYTVYAYSTTDSVSNEDPDMKLLNGDDGGTFAEDALESGAFSYDILNVEYENLGSDSYSETIFTARRMAGQGTVLFVSDYISPDKDPEEVELVSSLDLLFLDATEGFALDTEQYLADCEAYLVRFFGEDWRSGALDEEEAEACFLARNEKDNRYHLASQKAQGIEDEKQRLYKLREDGRLYAYRGRTRRRRGGERKLCRQHRGAPVAEGPRLSQRGARRGVCALERRHLPRAARQRLRSGQGGRCRERSPL